MTRPGFARLVLWSLAAGVIIWVALEMQSRVGPVNEACFGPLTDDFIREMYRVRAWTFAVSLIVGAPLVWLILRGVNDRRAWLWIGGAFLFWKTSGLITNAWASPMCWEPYANDAPFWNEGIAGLTWLLQQIGFIAFSVILLVLLAVMWGRWVLDQIQRLSSTHRNDGP